MFYQVSSGILFSQHSKTRKEKEEQIHPKTQPTKKPSSPTPTPNPKNTHLARNAVTHSAPEKHFGGRGVEQTAPVITRSGRSWTHHVPSQVGRSEKNWRKNPPIFAQRFLPQIPENCSAKYWKCFFCCPLNREILRKKKKETVEHSFLEWVQDETN